MLQELTVRRAAKTTQGIRRVVRCSEEDLEFVPVSGGYLAYNRMGYPRLRLNVEATRLLQARFHCGIKVYGKAVLVRG